MKFGPHIRRLRTKQKLTLRGVAAQLDVDPAYLSRVEAGKAPPSKQLAERIAPILGCSTEELALLAGHVPSTVTKALRKRSSALPAAARRLTSEYANGSPPSGPKKGRKAKPASGHIRGVSLPLFPEETRTETSSNDDEPTASRKEDKPRRVDPRNSLNALTSTEWIPETVSVWTQKGLGAGHPDAQIERQHPAPFSFTDVSRLVRFFSKPGDKVLDPFVGIGSTLKACALEGRHGVGIDLNPRYIGLSEERLAKEVRGSSATTCQQQLLLGDSRTLINTFDADAFDFVVTSPPYWNILHKEDHKATQERKKHKLDTRYSDDPKDLGNLADYDTFLAELASILGSCSRILKPKKYMAVVVSDFRDKSRFIMFHADLPRALEPFGFGLRGVTVLYQRHKKIFPYGYPYAYVPNIHHQYILILQNTR
jgi:DNA modification methylase